MKRKLLPGYIQNILRSWGVGIIERPDIYDGRNRNMVVIIDESVGDNLILENAFTFRMTSHQCEEIVFDLSEKICDKFMRAFVHAVNETVRWQKVLIERVSAVAWLKDAIRRIEFVFETYHISIKRFDEVDYWKCVMHFGGERNFRQLLVDAVSRDKKISDEFTMCLVCKNCRCKKNGERVCRKIYVEVEDPKDGIRTLRHIDLDIPISNKLKHILPTFEQREECGCFTPNNTEAIDWACRFRDAHF